MKKTATLSIIALFLVLILLLAACAPKAKQDTMEPKDDPSENIVEQEPEDEDELEPDEPSVGAGDELIGAWERIEDSQTSPDIYIIRLIFTAPNHVEYMVGWYLSDVAAIYEGTFTVNGSTLTLDMTATYGAEGDCHAEYDFSVTGNILRLEHIAGENLSVVELPLTPLELTRTQL